MTHSPRTVSALAVVIALALPATMGCQQQGGQSYERPPKAPRNEVQVPDYSRERDESVSALAELQTDKKTIENWVKQWESAKTSVGPKTSTEERKLVNRITEGCDQLENQARDLQSRPYVRDHSSTKSQVQELIDYARSTRDRVQD